MKIRLPLVLGLALALLPTLAHAHPGHDGHELTWGFTNGFAHPFTGWDHLLAMIAVGLWAGFLGGRARWSVPAAFVATMIVGAAVARFGFALPGVETAIAASLMAIGLLIALAVRLPASAAAPLIALFAFFHGFAHSSEMPATAHALCYGAGFVVATILLHAVGLQLSAKSSAGPRSALRLSGLAIAAAGCVALVIT